MPSIKSRQSSTGHSIFLSSCAPILEEGPGHAPPEILSKFICSVYQCHTVPLVEGVGGVITGARIKKGLIKILYMEMCYSVYENMFLIVTSFFGCVKQTT